MTVRTAETVGHDLRARPGRPAPAGGTSWGPPVALVGLSIIPVAAGVLRIIEIVGGPQILPANPRIDASPAPVVVHLVSAATYALVGAFQFSSRLRRRHPGWHRKAGRMLVGAGLVVAVSGMWITLLYPGAPGGAWLWTVRLVVGTAMGASVVLGYTAIRRHDIAAHRAWMIRAYALGLGAGTQVFTETLGEATLGAGDMSKAVSLTAGWLINAVVAEWAIRHRVRRRARSDRPRTAPRSAWTDTPVSPENPDREHPPAERILGIEPEERDEHEQLHPTTGCALQEATSWRSNAETSISSDPPSVPSNS
jgi:uncharacterized membrane protein